MEKRAMDDVTMTSDSLGCRKPESGEILATIRGLYGGLIELLWRPGEDAGTRGRIYARRPGTGERGEWDTGTECCWAFEAREYIGAAWGAGNDWRLDMESFAAPAARYYKCSLCGHPTDEEDRGGIRPDWVLCEACEGTPEAEARGYTHHSSE